MNGVAKEGLASNRLRLYDIGQSLLVSDLPSQLPSPHHPWHTLQGTVSTRGPPLSGRARVRRKLLPLPAPQICACLWVMIELVDHAKLYRFTGISRQCFQTPSGRWALTQEGIFECWHLQGFQKLLIGCFSKVWS